MHTLGEMTKALNSDKSRAGCRLPVYLAVLELAVNWEAEKLYGAEGLGPFDEF